MKSSRGLTGVLALVLLAAVVLVGRLGYVHVQYGEWGLAPSSSPSRLSFEGREYHRGGTVDAVPEGEVVVGHVGGGDLYGPARRAYPPTVLELRTPDGITGYSLSGGP